MTDESPATPWVPLVPLRPEGTRPPWFCVHALGGSVVLYKDLADAVVPDQPVYALEAPYYRHTPTVEALAARYVAAIQTVQPTGP